MPNTGEFIKYLVEAIPLLETIFASAGGSKEEAIKKLKAQIQQERAEVDQKIKNKYSRRP